MKLAEISIKRPSLVIVLFTLLTLGGLLSYSMMGYELIPKIENNMVTISTIYPGASPSEVETSVTRKIEDAVGSLENVKKVESSSYESLSVIMVQLNDGADVDFALNDAQRKVNAILADLPDDVKAPSLNKFSLDDFGTGYSNMQRIVKLPFDIIKLDRTFTELYDNPKLGIVLTNAINMIKAMKMKIVVEGVETEEMLKLFSELECEYIQGYYFSKPIPREEFVKFIQASS
jgi:c-di-GMP-related signal transduction protein